MQRVLPSLILSLLFGLQGISQNDCIQSIRQEYTMSNYGRVIELSEECSERHPKAIDLQEYIAYSYYHSGQFKEAKSRADSILRIDSSNLKCFLLLGRIYEAEENPPKAIKYYLSHFKSDSLSSSTCKKLANLFNRSGDSSSAFYYYKKAHQLNPKDVSVLASLSELFIDNDQVLEADSLLNIAYDLDSNNIKICLLKARTSYIQKEYEAAVQKLEKANYAIDFSPYFNKLYGYSLLRIDSIEKAIFYLEKALVGDKSNREHAHYYLGIAYNNKEMDDYALFHFDKAIESSLSENLSTYYKHLGLIHEKNRNFTSAIKLYNKALEWNTGKDDILWFYLARTCDKFYSDKSAPIQYYKNYLATSDPNPELREYTEKRIIHLKGIVHMSK